MIETMYITILEFLRGLIFMPIIFMDCIRFLVNLVLGCATCIIAVYVLLFTFGVCFNLISQVFVIERGEEDE